MSCGGTADQADGADGDAALPTTDTGAESSTSGGSADNDSADNDSADNDSTDNDPADSDSTDSAALAFSEDEDPTITVLRTLTKEDGICVVLDAYFDASFAPNAPLQPDSGNDLTFLEDPNYPLNTVDDGPFGQAWKEFIDSDDPMDEVIATNLNELSTEQCGYPVMDAFSETFRQECLTKIDETTGERGERTCTTLNDPRP